MTDRNNMDDIEIGQQNQPTNKNKHILAHIISIVLHPFFMAIYGVALLFVYTDFQYIFAHQITKFMGPVVIFSFMIPALSIYFFKRSGYITDYSLQKKEERFLPFLVTFFSYFVLFFYFLKAGLYSWFLAALLVPLILLIICSIINIRWKISAHMAGIGGLIGTVFSVCYNIKGQNPYTLFIILTILVGALGVSRIILQRHTPAQVYVGFLVGLVVSYVAVFVGGYYPLLLLLIR